MLREVKVTRTENPEMGYKDKDELLENTNQHRYDVSQVMDMVSQHIHDIGLVHDWTKIKYFDDFAQDTLERKDTPDFKQRPWYNIHTRYERHHINANVPLDVDFFDLIEMQVDCIVSGLTRAGEVNDDFLRIPDEVIIDAYWNTAKKLKDNIKLKIE